MQITGTVTSADSAVIISWNSNYGIPTSIRIDATTLSGKYFSYSNSTPDRYIRSGETKYFSIEGGYVREDGCKFWTNWANGVSHTYTITFPEPEKVVNKVVYNGNTLIDLTNDSLTSSDQLLSGIIAHGVGGHLITGSLINTKEILEGTVESISMESVVELNDYALAGQEALLSVNFPNVTYIGNYGLFSCINLSSVNLPSLEEINNYGMRSNDSLQSIIFPSLKRIQQFAFYKCPSLNSLTLSSSEVCVLDHINAFQGTPIESGTGYIYVPSSLVSSYKSATNWANFSSQITSI